MPELFSEPVSQAWRSYGRPMGLEDADRDRARRVMRFSVVAAVRDVERPPTGHDVAWFDRVHEPERALPRVLGADDRHRRDRVRPEGLGSRQPKAHALRAASIALLGNHGPARAREDERLRGRHSRVREQTVEARECWVVRRARLADRNTHGREKTSDEKPTVDNANHAAKVGGCLPRDVRPKPCGTRPKLRKGERGRTCAGEAS